MHVVSDRLGGRDGGGGGGDDGDIESDLSITDRNAVPLSAQRGTLWKLKDAWPNGGRANLHHRECHNYNAYER